MQLIRENGYINLNEFFFNKYGINVNEITDLRNVITLEQLGNRSKFWFDLDDRRVMFKEQYVDTLEAYAELILSLMIEKMQIPYLSAAKYDLAVLTYKDKKINCVDKKGKLKDIEEVQEKVYEIVKKTLD